MNEDIIRPMDLLETFKGKKVKLSLKDKTTAIGTLLSFDMYINIVLQDKKKFTFYRGEGILSIEDTNGD